MSAIRTPPVFRISVGQAVAVLLVSGLVAGIWGWIAARSLLLGGMISIIPNAYFAYRVFRESGARAMEKVVRNAYQGEFVKLVMIGVGFALVLTLVRPLNTPLLFAGFIGAHLLGLLLLIGMQYTHMK